VAAKKPAKPVHAPYVSVEDRREQLIDAAIAVMKREGVSKTTTRLVAAEADVPLSILHYCFKTKDDLLRAASRTLAAELINASRGAVAESGGGDLAASIRLAFRKVWAAALRDVDAQLCTYEVITWSIRERDRSRIARDQYRDYDEAVAAFLRTVAEAAGADYLYPVDALARWVFVTFDGMMLAYIVDRDERRALGTMDILIDAVVNCAIVKPPATGRRRPARAENAKR
jgi:AcrR family transcriptional regulator